MDIHHLKIFVAVYQNRSFSKASSLLYISQPTISEHIKNLENELGCQLFDRLGRTILPTAEAELILPHALQIIEDMGRLGDMLQQKRQVISGCLTIGASTIPGTYLLPAAAAAFKRIHPDVHFEILINDTARVADMVASHKLLLGVVGARVNHKQLDIIPFYQDELVCAAHPEQAARLGRDSDLRKSPFLFREKGSGTRTMMEYFLKKAGIDVDHLQPAAILGSTAAIKEALLASLGISILSQKAIREELRSGALVEIPLFPTPMQRDFFLICHKKRSLPAPYQAFRHQLLAK